MIAISGARWRCESAALLCADAVIEESKPQRSRRERGRRQHDAAENVAPENALTSAETVPAEQAKMQSNPVFAGADNEVSTICDCKVHGLNYLSAWLSHLV